jgi:25S rRNA (adenine2142-N1)-methyltransferase
MDAIGFSQLEERWKPGGKMIYWLYQRRPEQPAECRVGERFNRKKVLREGERNNFCVLLT